jgi:hypothetical protein
MLKHDHRAFTGFELADAAIELPKFFELGIQNLPSSSIEILDHLASSFFEELKTTRSADKKKAMLIDFISYAIYTGMLIREQRLAVDLIMYRNNTGLDN